MLKGRKRVRHADDMMGADQISRNYLGAPALTQTQSLHARIVQWSSAA